MKLNSRAETRQRHGVLEAILPLPPILSQHIHSLFGGSQKAFLIGLAVLA